MNKTLCPGMPLLLENGFKAWIWQHDYHGMYEVEIRDREDEIEAASTQNTLNDCFKYLNERG